MILQTPPMTADAFDRFIALPENATQMFEWIEGEIVTVPSNPRSSTIGALILGEIYVFIRGKNVGVLTGENSGYMVDGERYAPDVAFVAAHKLPLAETGYNPVPPDLVVEVVSSNAKQELADLRTKITHYLKAGAVVWAVFPQTQTVEVHVPGMGVATLGIDDVIDGGTVLPGFTLAVRMIFG
jgi:Uma2 family endonuclease